MWSLRRAHLSSLQQIWVGLLVFFSFWLGDIRGRNADSCPPEFTESLSWKKKSDLNLFKSIIRLISRCLFHLPQTSYNSSIESDVYMSQQGEAGFCCITENGLPREKRFSWPQQPACHSVRRKPLGCVFGYLPYFFFFSKFFCYFFFCSQHVFDYILTIVSMWLFLRCDLNLGLYTLSHIDCVFAFVWTVCWFASPIQTLAKSKPQIDPPKCGCNEVVQFKQLLDFRWDGRNAGFLSIMLTSFPPPN